MGKQIVKVIEYYGCQQPTERIQRFIDALPNFRIGAIYATPITFAGGETGHGATVVFEEIVATPTIDDGK